MRQARSQLFRTPSGNIPGGKKHGDSPAAKSPLVSATEIDALSRPEQGTKRRQPRRTQLRKTHHLVGEKGQHAQAVNRIQTRSSTVREKLAGKQVAVHATTTVNPFTPSYCVSPNPSLSTVRDRQQALLDQEGKKKRKAIEEYNASGDPNVFAPFLAPFISTSNSGLCGKRRKLGEWQWDREVERHWREDKTSGQPGVRIWAPVEESFL
ncbi:hypothetical protein QBC36DRAFT_230425 [Triangularia setosa]|uniref:Uncharacterized protein n=1 Tax=Triangularia setosa TaxID=2587417 RepID=A0AAN6WDZ2_9PEZI|nr:hypothetical protein QBC36DRAFT_230425 [Podospora setosa]